MSPRAAFVIRHWGPGVPPVQATRDASPPYFTRTRMKRSVRVSFIALSEMFTVRRTVSYTFPAVSTKGSSTVFANTVTVATAKAT